MKGRSYAKGKLRCSTGEWQIRNPFPDAAQPRENWHPGFPLWYGNSRGGTTLRFCFCRTAELFLFLWRGAGLRLAVCGHTALESDRDFCKPAGEKLPSRSPRTDLVIRENNADRFLHEFFNSPQTAQVVKFTPCSGIKWRIASVGPKPSSCMRLFTSMRPPPLCPRILLLNKRSWVLDNCISQGKNGNYFMEGGRSCLNRSPRNSTGKRRQRRFGCPTITGYCMRKESSQGGNATGWH